MNAADYGPLVTGPELAAMLLLPVVLILGAVCVSVWVVPVAFVVAGLGMGGWATWLILRT